MVLAFLAHSTLSSFPLQAEGLDSKELAPLQISHVGADAVYLNGGRSHGLSVGQTIAVLRNGDPVAELQVAFVSKKSASCRVVNSRLEIRLGDEAIPVSSLETHESPAPEPSSEKTADRPSSEPATLVKLIPIETPERPALMDTSGTVSLRWHQFEDGSEVPRSYDQSTVRLNLRSRSRGGHYEARVRIRGREDHRYRQEEPAEVKRQDRLYEAAITYEPPEGRIILEMGRMTSSPQLGFDYLDGVVGEFKIGPRFGVGAFFGQRSDVDEIGFGSDNDAYGAFIHYKKKRTRESLFYADLLLGGIREAHDGDISRDFITVYGRLGSGNQWSLYQRANVDINTDWRQEISGSNYQVSNVLTSFNYRFTDSLRLGISYDHRRRYRDFENRDTPEEIFDDRLREGLRLNAQIGDPRGWRLTTSLGVRRQEDGEEDAYTGTGSIFHTNVGNHNFLLGVDFSGFSGETSEGYRVSVRTRKYFKGGHDLGLTLGTTTTTNTISGELVDSEDQWVRINGTARLPKRFFILGEIEITEGDNLTGERLVVQVGYRL